MNNTRRGMRDSLLIHAVVILTVTLSIQNATVPGKPLVIDFSLANTTGDTHHGRDKSPAPASLKQHTTARQLHSAQPFTPSLPAVDSNPLAVTQNQVALPVAGTAEPRAVSQERGKGESKNTAVIAVIKDITHKEGIGSAIRSFVTPEEEKKKYLGEHFVYIRDLIMKNLAYPLVARRMGWSGKVLVSFVVREDGSVEEPKVVESSGFGVLDKNAVETIRRVAPFPRPPVRAELVVPIVYKFD